MFLFCLIVVVCMWVMFGFCVFCVWVEFVVF